MPSQSTLFGDGRRASKMQGESSSIDALAKGSQSRAIPKTQSDPTLRSMPIMNTVEKREPRFFGATTTRPSSQTAVRCSGFQKMDWPAQQTGAKQKPAGRSGPHSSKERSRAEPHGGGTPLGA